MYFNLLKYNYIYKNVYIRDKLSEPIMFYFITMFLKYGMMIVVFCFRNEEYTSICIYIHEQHGKLNRCRFFLQVITVKR